MIVPLLFMLVFGAAIAIGLWRRVGAVQWIWILFGAAITMLVIWLILLTFVIGPEMHRTGAPGAGG